MLSEPARDVAMQNEDATQSPGLPRGARVVLFGLQGRADLNGAEATLLGWHPDKGRHSVAVVLTSERVLLRPANLARQRCGIDRLDGLVLRMILSSLASWQSAAPPRRCQSWRTH